MFPADPRTPVGVDPQERWLENALAAGLFGTCEQALPLPAARPSRRTGT
jgi:hypothetical protein